MHDLLSNTLALLLNSSPWLVLGLATAGLVKAWLPVTLVARGLGGSGIGPVGRAALVGAPLPLCSCGVLPAAIALRRAGASRASTTSFLVSTPETGVDSVALSWVLLGPILAIVRPVAAVCSAIVTGLTVGWLDRLGAADEPAAPRPDRGHVHTHAHTHDYPLWFTLPCFGLLLICGLRRFVVHRGPVAMPPARSH